MKVLRLGLPLLLGLGLGGLTLACSAAGGPAVVPTQVEADPFAVVRATSVAAYASGKAHLANGELEQALIDLDTAETNDPDHRADIQQALDQTLAALSQQTPSPEPTLAAGQPIVVATVPAIVAATVPASGTGATPLAGAAQAPQPGAAQTPQPSAAQTPLAGAAQAPVADATSSSLVGWVDPQGRFTLSAPDDWLRADQPQSLFGTAVVEFHDQSGRAEFDVAVDGASKVVSPELYAASMEITMQEHLPGYAAEQMSPGSTSSNPSVRRTFTFTQTDAAGQAHQARGLQVTVVKGSTPYIIAGSAPAADFAQFGPTFDQMLETFRFS